MEVLFIILLLSLLIMLWVLCKVASMEDRRNEQLLFESTRDKRLRNTNKR